MFGFLAPRFWPAHLAMLACVAIAGGLGVWQLHAWQEHRAEAALDLSRVAPIPLAQAMGPDDPFPGDQVGRPVVVAGTWVPSGTLLVAGRRHKGVTGFWVMTPLAVSLAGGSADPDAPALLLVRGWTPDAATAPPPPQGDAELTAWLEPPEGDILTDEDPTDDVIPQVRIADAIQHVDQDLYGAFGVVADKTAPGDYPAGDRATNPGTVGLTPVAMDQEPSVGPFTGVRNLLYAIEWWIFGGFAVFVWGRHLADSARAGRRGEGAAEESGSDPVPSTS